MIALVVCWHYETLEQRLVVEEPLGYGIVDSSNHDVVIRWVKLGLILVLHLCLVDVGIH